MNESVIEIRFEQPNVMIPALQPVKSVTQNICDCLTLSSM